MKDFEFLSHTADLKMRAYGHTYAELFRNALMGMFQSCEPTAEHCRHRAGRLVCERLTCTHTITLQSLDIESLLVDFLSQALYLADVHDEVYLDAVIHTIDECSLGATLRGVHVITFKTCEIKAVTYHDLKIDHEGQLLYVDVVFDI